MEYFATYKPSYLDNFMIIRTSLITDKDFLCNAGIFQV